jgi:hypothetical protein
MEKQTISGAKNGKTGGGPLISLVSRRTEEGKHDKSRMGS